jgi:hypothetical protein
MARFFAQLLSPVFVFLGVGGWFLGDAGTAGRGELGSLDVDLTWARDALDVGVLVLLLLVGFVLSRHTGRLLMGGLGVVLLLIGIAGFPAGEGGFLGMRGATAMNAFDIAVGALALLAAAGTVEEAEPPQGSFLRGG